MIDGKCPGCGGPKVLAGHLGPGQNAAVFVPYGMPIAFQHPNGHLAPGCACLDCGHAWFSHKMTVAPEAIRTLIRERGGELTRQWLDELDEGPCRDLPDADWAREIGEAVSRLDAEARAGNDSTVVRLYRDLTRRTWDEAIRDAGRWGRLSRAEKLALFGWEPKGKPAKPVLADDLV